MSFRQPRPVVGTELQTARQSERWRCPSLSPATALIGRARHSGNCSSTIARTVSPETVSWPACISMAAALPTLVVTHNQIRSPAAPATKWVSTTSHHTGICPKALRSELPNRPIPPSSDQMRPPIRPHPIRRVIVRCAVLVILLSHNVFYERMLRRSQFLAYLRFGSSKPSLAVARPGAAIGAGIAGRRYRHRVRSHRPPASGPLSVNQSDDVHHYPLIGHADLTCPNARQCARQTSAPE